MNKNDFINTVVLDWMKNDLLRMKSLQSSSSEKGNINFPLASCVLSYMDSLGGYLFGTRKGFEANVEKYINTCFENPGEYNATVLKDLMRNGLIHAYLPGGAISRNGKRPVIYKGRTYKLVLDAETLVNDFIDSLKNFVIKLETEKYEMRSKEEIENMNKFMEKHKDFIAKLERQDNDDLATPSSGPSGPSGPIN